VSERLPDDALERLLDAAAPLLHEMESRIPPRYRVEREIGRGGMGVVYAAFDLELRRDVAIKILADGAFADPLRRARFVAEARIVARLRHPGIATVYDAGDEYIAMERIDGGSLDRASPRDDRQAVTWIRDAARAIEHAHESGVVHRDVKPQNLLLDGDRVVVTDFGLARDARAAVHSHSGSLIGTPSYMAPEQLGGDRGRIGPATDVYGLGATLHHLLIGAPPFVAGDVVELLAKIANDPLPRPSKRRPGPPGLPRDLERVLVKALAKDPGERYASAAALADDLDRWLAGRPVLATAPSPARRVSRFVARHERASALAAIALVALAALGIVAYTERARGSASAEGIALSRTIAAVLQDVAALGRRGEIEARDERLAEGLAACDAFLARHELAAACALKGKLLREAGRLAEARPWLDRALALDANDVGARLERGLVLAEEFTRQDAAAGPSTVGFALRDLAIGDLERVAMAPDLTRLERAFATGESARLRGDLVAARAAYEDARRLDPTHAGAMLGLSRVALREGDPELARSLAMSAVDLYRGFGPVYDSLSRQQFATGELRGGELGTALADLRLLLDADPSNASAHAARAEVAMRRAQADRDDPAKLGSAIEDYDDAIREYSQALALAPTLDGARNNRAVARLERAALLDRRGDHAGAAESRAAALADLDEAITRAPRFGLARLNRAIARRVIAAADPTLDADERAAFGAAARADLAAMLELKPGDAAALRELGHW
jgi:tetratricopeptide (TPR) repeat protein/predicted Ser/Thr protein kinase